MRSIGSRPFRPGAAALLLLTAVGCNSGAPTGNVKGEVTYNNKALKTGQVSFMGKDGTPRSFPINDGRYEANGLPVGEYFVTVTSLAEPEGAGSTDRMKPRDARAGKGTRDAPSDPRTSRPKSAIPERYAKVGAGPEESGLKFEVKPGDNTFPIPLK
jgi:hypothetical protein